MGASLASAPGMSDRTLEVHCRNCGARFAAWYGEGEAGTEVRDVEKCGRAAAIHSRKTTSRMRYFD